MPLSSAWRKGLAIGCASVVILALAAAALIARNWPTLTSYYRQVTAAVANLTHASSTLQAKFGGTVRVFDKYQSGVEGSTLSIAIVNPSFLEQINPDGSSGREKALDVAAAARDALAASKAYEHYEVVFVRQSGSLVNVTRTWTFRFEPGDLPPGPVAGAPGPEQILGVWRGTSICTDRVAAPACNDETVVYEFVRDAKPGVVHWAADKIVDGRREPMGAFDVTYDAAERCWKAEYHSRVSSVWRLSVDGTHMTGTGRLLPGNEQIRALDLRKE